jgi:3-deoxy-manno-octulosonate cytidylyltransferase (CMP-KDO synthetase)
MEFRVIIPARYDSTRLPGKVLADINGKPMLQHVFQRAMESGADSVVIATDSPKVSKVAQSFGAKVCITSADHQSGTERIAEAALTLDYASDEIVVNVQADQPFILPQAIRQVAEDLEKHDNVKVSSICEKITEAEDLFNPSVVKVVLNWRNYAVYFSRAPIPWDAAQFKDWQDKLSEISPGELHYRHIGLYAYRVGFLQEYIEWPASPLEQMESLEQLRILWNGSRMHMVISKDHIPPEVNLPEDLEKIKEYSR